MTTAIVIVLVAVLLFAALRLWVTANRLDRLHVRTEAAWFALEGALARRIVATRAVAATGGLESPLSDELRRYADIADRADRAHRADAENDLSRALATIPTASDPELAAELADASERVVLARRFYNDAVRDTRALRAVLFTRIFGLAGRAALPDYFEIAEDRQRPAPPVTRTAARVVLIDQTDRVLLLSGTDPQVASQWWITPGGGVESGEDLADTARRELAEETGLRLESHELIGPIWRRVARFRFTGVDYEQTEFYFAARAHAAHRPDPASNGHNGGHNGSAAPLIAQAAVGGSPGAALVDPAAGTTATLPTPETADDGTDGPLDVSGHTELERLTLTGHRWWTAQALAGTEEAIYPVELAARLPEALDSLRSGVAPEPVVEVS